MKSYPNHWQLCIPKLFFVPVISIKVKLYNVVQEPPNIPPENEIALSVNCKELFSSDSFQTCSAESFTSTYVLRFLLLQGIGGTRRTPPSCKDMSKCGSWPCIEG